MSEELNRNLFLYDEISSKVLKPLIEEIVKINEYDDQKEKELKDYERDPIKLYINCPGGDAYDTWGFVDLMEQSKTPIHTIVQGLAMSGGFAIAISGHKRFAGKRARFMFHEVLKWIGWSKLEHHKREIEEAEWNQKIYDEIVLSKTKIKESDIKEVRERMKDWFFDGNEALKLGCIDELL